MSHALRRLRPLAAGLGSAGVVGGVCLQQPASAQQQLGTSGAATANHHRQQHSGKWTWSAGAAGSSKPEPTGGGKSYADWVADENTIRIPLEALVAEYVRVLEKIGMPPDRAALVAKLIGDNQKDGVYSHGLNRFNNFLTSMSPDAPGGVPIDVTASPELVSSFGVMEQYDGKMGVGPYNASVCMARAVELAEQHGIGCVSLRNTNHWQRGGAYGLQAADAGMIGICWTNTTGNMPPWGSAEIKVSAATVSKQSSPPLHTV